MEQDYKYLCNNCYDREFDSVESLKRYPWVGSQYVDCKCHILIIGDSHYTVDGDKNFCEDEYKRCNSNKDYTREVIRYVINDVCEGKPTWTMYRNLINTITSYTPEEVKFLWSKVAFYNFIQEPMKQIDQEPTSEESRVGWLCFYDIVNILKPDICLFIGIRSRNEIETIQSLNGTYTIVKDVDKCNNTSPYYGEVETKEGNKTRYRIIKHASSYYSPEAWYKYLSKKEPEILIQLDRNYNNKK